MNFSDWRSDMTFGMRDIIAFASVKKSFLSMRESGIESKKLRAQWRLVGIGEFHNARMFGVMTL
jgi:hypothetical protein